MAGVHDVSLVEWPLSAAQKSAVGALIAVEQKLSGRQPLSDQLAIDLANDSPGVLACIDQPDPTSTALTGYAQASPVNDGYLIGTVGTQTDHGSLVAELRRRINDAPVTWWVFEPTSTTDQAAATAGLHPGRELLQMRCPLPLPASVNAVYEKTPRRSLRAFRPGVDEAEWVDVNNAAFAWHPEQGGWTVDDVIARQRESWWDPEGVRVLDIDGRMAGFCWTKIHVQPALGEIYVIAVHPDFHGLGLGRLLTVDGLNWLAERGLNTGMLYVDADNHSAVGLYRSLGFSTAETQRAYTNTTSEEQQR